MTSVFVWTVSDVFGLILCVVIAVTLIPIYLWNWIKTLRCQHPSVIETQACDAICTKCGANLGFISAWRNKK